MAWNFDAAISHYKALGAPADQNVLIGLLREVQEAHNGIPSHLLSAIADAYGIKVSILLALIRRIPSLRMENKHCLEICTGKVCGASAALAALGEKIASDSITVKFVPCMRHCGKGPNIRWNGVVHHKADEALIRKLITSTE